MGAGLLLAPAPVLGPLRAVWPTPPNKYRAYTPMGLPQSLPTCAPFRDWGGAEWPFRFSGGYVLPYCWFALGLTLGVINQR